MKHHRYLRAAAILLTSAICCASVPAASFEAATETISDLSEDVADTLTVLSVKRSF